MAEYTQADQLVERVEALSERVGGDYSPSPGVVYPTLSLLEDTGLASASVDEGGRKLYAITEEGKKYLEENRAQIDAIFGRLQGELAVVVLERMGFRVRRAPLLEAGRHHWWSAARPAEIAEELNALLRDPEVRAIIAHDGGQTALGLLGPTLLQ